MASDDEDDDEEKRPAKRTSNGGPRFRTGSPGRKLGANEVYLSEQRIAAMKEAGVWDDPVARAKQLKRYKQYDLEHAHDRERD